MIDLMSIFRNELEIKTRSISIVDKIIRTSKNRFDIKLVDGRQVKLEVYHD